MANDSQPFHLRDIDDETQILPRNTQIDSDAIDPQVRTESVEIGSIQTNPHIDYAQYIASGQGLSSSARVTEDGRIVISLDLKQKLPDLPTDYARDVQEFALDSTRWEDVPPLNIVIMIVGSRGDVQPYVALGKALQKDRHRIRVATHETFRTFVQDAGLEFFNIGGNPQDLMSYMVKNPGLVPGIESLTNGDIRRKRKMLKEMIDGCWKACYEPDDESGRTWAADAIISNPPAFAHVHCAEALGIPLLLSFTMPWSPTTSFPHPLVNIKQSNAERGLTNHLSYVLADLLTWHGVGDIINKFRSETLGLTPLKLRSGAGLVDRLKVPWTYCMSPSLVPKPDDWKNYIDVVGFYFLDLGTQYQPDDALVKFLQAGTPPVYIGFGSVVVDDPMKMSQTIFSATKRAGTRALVSAGWGGLGGLDIPEHVFILGNVPHDWLFDRVSAVVHHGGAGTTAIGLAKGKPTVVVPFFGDQPFWGMMIHRAGAGPEPIPHKELDVDNLTDALEFALSPGATTSAQRLAQTIKDEDGVKKGVESFYRHLPLLNMRCDLDPSRLAVWWSTEQFLKLSVFAAQTLVDAKLLDIDTLDTHRPKDYDTTKQISDPITGGGTAIFWTITHYYASIAEIFYSPISGIIKTTTAIPKGVMDIVISIQEGLYNAPRLYGSKVREHGKVTGFTSGIKEGGKGLFMGYYEGITGLVKEPLEGARKEGFIGAIKGSARSFVNATVRPAAGIVGVVAYPLQGAWKSTQKTWAKKQEQINRTTRISDGLEAVRNSSAEERRVILEKFRQAKLTTAERQKWYKDMAEQVVYEASEDKKLASSSKVSWDPSPSSSPGPSTHTSVSGRTSALDEDEAFERDLELAKQLSLAEQRGYERGIASRYGEVN